MNNLFQDVLQVFGVVREEFSLTSKPSSNSGLDYSFITPTLLGKLDLSTSIFNLSSLGIY